MSSRFDYIESGGRGKVPQFDMVAKSSCSSRLRCVKNGFNIIKVVAAVACRERAEACGCSGFMSYKTP